MKKLFLFTLALIISWTQMSAQKTTDVLYLKNGSKIFGKLIEVNSSQYKIQTSDGSEMIYPVTDVEKFSKETPLFDGRKTEGFTFTIETGLLIGPQSAHYSAPFSFNFLAGFTSKTKNTISFGSGVEFIGRPFTPLYIEYKYLFYDRKTSPFIFFRGGAIVPFGGNETSTSSGFDYDYSPKNYKGGGSFGFGSGVSWAKEDYDIFFSFAYRYAHTSYEQYDHSRGDVTYKNNLNRLELKIGLKF